MPVAVPGTKPKPYLSVVREGNPGKRPIKEGVKFAPSKVLEPKWSDFFPGTKRAELRARKAAAALWAQTARVLETSAGLTNAQGQVLIDYCVTWARIQQGERVLSIEGVLVKTERGYVKHPWTTVLNQYRVNFRSLTGELGLSPSAATRLDTGGLGDDNDDTGILD